MTDNKFKVEFVPGCFDEFEGTQEELNELMAEIVESIQDIDWSELGEEIDVEDNTVYLHNINELSEDRNRKLN